MRFLKSGRVVISTAVFFLLTFVFLDPYHIVPVIVLDVLTVLQAGPSLIKIGSGFYPGLIALAGIIAVTLLWGRIYCSTLCPLGTFQDIINRIPQWINRRNKRRFLFQKPFAAVQYGIAGLSVIGVFIGSIFLVNLLEPFSNYGRSINAIGNPLIISINNLAASTAIRWGYFGISQLAFRQFDALALVMPVLFLLFVGVLTYKKGRLFCTMMCPVGGILSILSRMSFYKISIIPGQCKDCGLCEKICKARCIDAKNHTIEFSACIGCMNCIDACPTGGVQYIFKRREQEPAGTPQGEDKSRRKFLGSLALIPALRLVDRAKSDQTADTLSRYAQAKRKPIAPPGAISTKHFTRTCTACHLCVSECPTQVLYPAGFEYGLSGFFQPKMNYSAAYCNYDCTVCGEVCPTGALRKLEKPEKKLTQIGKAEFQKDDCIVITKKKDCGACSEHCPTKAVRMVPYENRFLPEVHSEYCIGCGACEHACPVSPEKAIFVAANEFQEKAQKPVQEIVPKSAQQQLQDFPF